MANLRSGTWVRILLALIAGATAISVALISRNVPTASEPKPTIEAAIVEEPGLPPAPRSPVVITGVLIGRTGDDPFVSEVITQFAPKDEIAITVRYAAGEEVANFPVRLSARVFSGIGNGDEEQISDISRPGESFWTFRFKPKDGWISSQQLVSIEIDGHKAYSQMLTIKHG